MDKLKQARAIINETDEEMARLFEKRMQAVEQVARYKKEKGLPVFDAKREAEILSTCEQRIKDPAYVESYRDFIKQLMDLSKQYQKKVLSEDVVAYPGVEGAFSHMAALSLFPDAQLAHYQTFPQVVMAVEEGAAKYGVLPFENSYTGEVGEVLDLLHEHDVSIVDTLALPIDQNLLGIKGASIKDIKQIYSHQQGLSQCAQFLSGRAVELIPYPNTALAAKYVSACQDPHKGAIASKATADYYDLALLAENINTAATNTTRFIVISKTPVKEGNRFAMMVTIKHETGALAKVIELIARCDYNMENIKSRSLKDRPWEYYFLIEVVGSLKEEKANRLMQELKAYCEQFRLIGSYARKDV